MRTVERISSLVGRWFAVIVVTAGAVALLSPDFFAAGAPAISWLLGLIMLGMGMTLRGHGPGRSGPLPVDAGHC